MVSANSTLTSGRYRILLKSVLFGLPHHRSGNPVPVIGEQRNPSRRSLKHRRFGLAGLDSPSLADELRECRTERHAPCISIQSCKLMNVVSEIDIGSHASTIRHFCLWRTKRIAVYITGDSTVRITEHRQPARGRGFLILSQVQ